MKQNPKAQIENDQQVYLDFTIDKMLSHIRLLEDHFLDIATDRNVMQCLACSYWHLFSLMAYDSLERPKFDPNYDTRFLHWLEAVIDELEGNSVAIGPRAMEIVKQLREWRYFFAGEGEKANIPVEMHNVPERFLELANMPEIPGRFDELLGLPEVTEMKNDSPGIDISGDDKIDSQMAPANIPSPDLTVELPGRSRFYELVKIPCKYQTAK